jgi:DNA-binding NarL/FixJ family response regulator
MNTVELTLKTMRVYLVDSSRLLNEGLTDRLAELPGLEVVGQADNLADAVREVRLQTPDVVMLDVSLLGQSGLDLVNAVSREENAPFVMVLAGNVSGFEAGPDILLYKASSVASAVAILENLLRHFQSPLEQ